MQRPRVCSQKYIGLDPLQKQNVGQVIWTDFLIGKERKNAIIILKKRNSEKT